VISMSIVSPALPFRPAGAACRSTEDQGTRDHEHTVQAPVDEARMGPGPGFGGTEGAKGTGCAGAGR